MDKTIIVSLEEGELLSAIESEASEEGVSESDIIIQALRFWLWERGQDREESEKPPARETSRSRE